MEEDDSKLQENLPAENEGESRRTRVGFPQTPQKKQGRGKLIFIILAILALLAVGGWLILGNRDEGDASETSPTPTITRTSPTPIPTQAEVDREGIAIKILNGTGISGAAGALRDELSKLGYENLTVGNASNQNYENTQVTFASDIDENIKEEITDKLESLYEDVDVKEGNLANLDVEVITGYPKGHTPTPTVKATATSTPTPKPTGASSTTTPTTTSSPTPTP